MIFVYPNYYGLPVLKEEDADRGVCLSEFRGDDEYWDEDIDIFKQADDEYVEETLNIK